MRSSLCIAVLLFCIGSGYQMHGQQNQLPIDEWIASLSIKKDLRSTQFNAIRDALLALDSVSMCTAFEALEEQGPVKNRRFGIRIRRLESELMFNGKHCPAFQPIEDVLKEALQIAYEIEDPILIVELNQSLAWYYTVHLDYGSAVMYALIADEMKAVLGKEHFMKNSMSLYHLGYGLYHSREYPGAITTTLAALHWHEDPRASPVDTLPDHYKMQAWNTIGLCYQKLGNYDSAFIAFDHALKWSGDDPFWHALIDGNRGDVFYEMGQYDSAAPLLIADFEESKARKLFHNAANSLQWLARIQNTQGNPQEALSNLREANMMLQKIPDPAYQANTYAAFTQVFRELGNADSVYAYTQKYLTLHDSIEQKASENRTEIVHMRLQNQENVNKIQALNKEKRRISMIRNFIIAFILLCAALGYLILNRAKLKMQIRQQEALEGKRKAEAEAVLAKDQLIVFTQHLREKTQLVENLQERLFNKEMTEEQKERISELSQHTILTDGDWEKFRGLFENVYPGFFQTLRQKSSDITLAEQRMAAFCKLQVPAKEVANLLGISPNSVNKTRQRLRHRLGLDPNVDLEAFFMADSF